MSLSSAYEYVLFPQPGQENWSDELQKLLRALVEEEAQSGPISVTTYYPMCSSDKMECCEITGELYGLAEDNAE